VIYLGQESQAQKFEKLLKFLKRELEEIDNRLEMFEADFQKIEGAVKAANEFREIMNDLEALVSKDLHYFKVVTRVWKSEDGKQECDVKVKGHSIEFTAENVDCSTPIGKILEAVLTKEENLRHAFAQAFLMLSNFAWEISRAMDLRDSLDRLEQQLDSLRSTLERIKEVCR
jgi:DNA repair exonuclease SbcCD ATPase subunit